jgi:CRISPR-associated exonuclease Cas4
MSPTTILLLTIVLTLCGVAVWLWLGNQQLREEADLPAGKMIYADGARTHQTETLYATDYGLSGKPDYLIQLDDDTIIPVELKSSYAPADDPYDGHIMQVVAYCLLVEENYGIRPPYGLLKYRDQTFEVAFDAQNEQLLLDILAEMHEALYGEPLERDHDNPSRCAACAVRDFCDERIDL